MAGYFDNAATSGAHPEAVAKVVTSMLSEAHGSPGRSLGSEGALHENILRAGLTEILGLGSSASICLTASATEALNTILKGLCYQKGDVVFHTPFCHNSVLRPLYYLERTRGIKLKTVPFDAFSLEEEAWRAMLLEDKPRAVVFPLVGNVFGNVLSGRNICKLVRECSPETVIIVDCAQAAGAMPVGDEVADADFVVFAGHKSLLGIPGCSGFAINSNNFNKSNGKSSSDGNGNGNGKERVNIEPLIHGGTGIESVSHDNPSTIPDRFEAGTRNIYAMAALQASVSWILKEGVDSIHARELANRRRLLDLLMSCPLLHPILPEAYSDGNCEEASRKNDNGRDENVPEVKLAGIISASVDMFTPSEFAQILYERGVITRAGLQCAPLAHEHLGTEPGGTVRFSVNVFTNDADFERLESALAFIASEL